MGVACGEVSVWDERILARIFALRYGWGKSEALDRSMVWEFSTSIDSSEGLWDCIQ